MALRARDTGLRRPADALRVCLGRRVDRSIVFPYLPKTRQIFERSTIQWRIAGIPLLTIAGALSLAFWVISLYFNFTTPVLGASSATMRWFVIGCLVVPCFWFVGNALYRRRQGVDVSLAFAELPPE